MRHLRALIILALLSVTACAPAAPNCGLPEVFCVGLVTNFGSVDTGINRDAWLGLQDAKAANSVDRIDNIQTVDVRDRAANIQALVGDGYDVIVTVGASMADLTAKAAAKYPHVLFIGVEEPQSTQLPNLAALIFHEEYSGFLAGALAARLTGTKHVAAVCDARFVDPIRRYCDGFAAGARYILPGIQVTATYRDASSQNLFNDPDWGRKTALQQVNEGADVLFAAGGRTAEAALQAAASQGIAVIGSETDLYLDLPDIRPELASSATNDIRSALTRMLKLARRGKFPSGDFTGTVRLAPWHEFEQRIPADVRPQLDKTYARLTGKIIPLDIPYTQP